MEFKKPSKELLEEAKKCTTEEEKNEFIQKHKAQLSDEVLNYTVGGGVFDVLTCNSCGRSFDSIDELVAHVLRDHIFGD